MFVIRIRRLVEGNADEEHFRPVHTEDVDRRIDVGSVLRVVLG